MSRANTLRRSAEAAVASATEFTHGGAVASPITDEQRLRRSVLATFLNERQFYEDGEDIAQRIDALALKVSPDFLSRLAIEAREEHGLRHVALRLLVALTRTGAGVPGLVSGTFDRVVRRADEIAEFVALYWANGKRPLSAQAKVGLARAFGRFDAHQLAKYDRDGDAVRLRDVMFLVRPRPDGQVQESTFRDLANRTLAVPDTWEVRCSRGEDKRAVFEDLLRRGNLGYLALLRNLRGMSEAGVPESLIHDAVLARKGAKGVLPFQYLSAADAVPRFAGLIDRALSDSIADLPRLRGKTVIVGDVSGSMNAALSGRSARNRLDAMAILVGCLVSACDHPVVYATAGSDSRKVHKTKLIRALPGSAMVAEFRQSMRELGGGGIFLSQAMEQVRASERSADRVIVITDEQDMESDPLKMPDRAHRIGRHNYLINVASARNGIGYRKWTHLDGFSDAVLKWIPAHEADGDLA
jgi:60 kDa SS-A/Ro ribonucleoprotein